MSLVRGLRDGRKTGLLWGVSSVVFSLDVRVPGESFGKLVLLCVHLCWISIWTHWSAILSLVPFSYKSKPVP